MRPAKDKASAEVLSSTCAYPVRKRLTKKGPDPLEEDLDMKELRGCADDVLDFSNPSTTTRSMGTTQKGRPYAQAT